MTESADPQSLAVQIAKLILDTGLTDERRHTARVIGLMETINVMIWASLFESGRLQENEKIPRFTEFHTLFEDRVQIGMLSYLSLPAGERPKL